MDTFNVRTIILFGSVARKDFRDTSDIDLLLVTGQKLKIREVKQLIPKQLLPKKREIGISIYSEEEFLNSYEKGSLFIVHLLNEGIVIYDDGFFKKLLLKPFVASKNELNLTLRLLKNRLDVTKDLSKFNNFFIGVLADYFSIFKNTSITLLAKDEKFIFNKKRAFNELKKIYPEHKQEIRKLSQLEPFFLRSIKGIKTPYPFSPHNENKVAEMRKNIEKLLALGIEHYG